MSVPKRALTSTTKPLVFTIDPTECPFREFRDNELQTEFWGMGPAAYRAYTNFPKGAASPKPPQDYMWIDEQTQPLPRSVRKYLHGWVRAEELALDRWDAEVQVFGEDGSKMTVADTQLSHAQVLLRSVFCRKVLSACFILERSETVYIEHQWELFNCAFGPEGWRAKYHIYSPGMKAGGGVQHRPMLSKNGCYLVRLYYLGAWRCIWVSDQVPVDATDSPLLPFSPLMSKAPLKVIGKQAPAATATANVVYLWPLLICKALLKLAAPNMNSDEYSDSADDEPMEEFDILHAFTGAMNLKYIVTDPEKLWELMKLEVPVFNWNDDEDTQASTIKTKSAKKPTAKEVTGVKVRGSLTYLILRDTKDYPPFHLPGITPGCQMSALVTMLRDVPIKKPLPEPEVPQWKSYRWVDWARSHGLYELYDCPRTKFLKLNGLMKLSYAPHLLDVQSTESLTVGFIKAEMTTPGMKDKKAKNEPKTAIINPMSTNASQIKEELREWMIYQSVAEVTQLAYTLYYPSLYQLTSAASSPPIRVTKLPLPRHLDVLAPKSAPLYLQIDGPEENNLKISLSMLHPRILANTGSLREDHIESAYLVLEQFEWFKDTELPRAKAFIRTCGYDAVIVNFEPGRHYCRIWVHSQLNWHVMLISKSALQLGSKNHIQVAAMRECPWASIFLGNLGAAFYIWLKNNRSNQYLPSVQAADIDFFRSYEPDLTWDSKIVGYNRSLLHWMFRQALESHLMKKLHPQDFRNVCVVLRKYFCDPDFGLPVKPLPPSFVDYAAIAAKDPCDCLMPEMEEVEMMEQEPEIQETTPSEEILIVSPTVMDKLLREPVYPTRSNICDAATEEVPCGILKEERAKVIKKHQAATAIQAFWRGFWARKCLFDHVIVSPEVLKNLSESIYGNQESLSILMNEFFRMYPGTKYAYSVASALSGVYGIHQHTGISVITRKCKWIPYFQGVFYCHGPVKVHFDINSSIPQSIVVIYDNDSGKKLPQAFSAHKTFDIYPNSHGFTVQGYGTLNQASGVYSDAHWQLTTFSSTEGLFHVCDNGTEESSCIVMPLANSYKLHIDEIFIPNRRNILGGIHLSVAEHEAVSFRAEATSPDLQMIAILRSISSDGLVKELAYCAGKGEIFWPYIRLEPAAPPEPSAQAIHKMTIGSARSLIKGLKSPKPATGEKKRMTKSSTKIKSIMGSEDKQYCIEVVAPLGWPLTIDQWRRVDEVRNSQSANNLDFKGKKIGKERSAVIKVGSAKEKPQYTKKSPHQPPPALNQPQPGDAYIELECSIAIGGGITASREEERDREFAEAKMLWNANDPTRNKRGADIRKAFRDEFLETSLAPPTESVHSTIFDSTIYEGGEGDYEHLEETQPKHEPPVQGPTPASETTLVEMTLEDEEELKYLQMPELLRDNFLPLDFVEECTKELTEDECVLMNPGIEKAAKKDRQARIDAALERMKELQMYNEVNVLERQKDRCRLLEDIYVVDAQWPPNLTRFLEERDEAIVLETLLRNASAIRKKQEAKPIKK